MKVAGLAVIFSITGIITTSQMSHALPPRALQFVWGNADFISDEAIQAVRALPTKVRQAIAPARLSFAYAIEQNFYLTQRIMNKAISIGARRGLGPKELEAFVDYQVVVLESLVLTNRSPLSIRRSILEAQERTERARKSLYSKIPNLPRRLKFMVWVNEWKLVRHYGRFIAAHEAPGDTELQKLVHYGATPDYEGQDYGEWVTALRETYYIESQSGSRELMEALDVVGTYHVYFGIGQNLKLIPQLRGQGVSLMDEARKFFKFELGKRVGLEFEESPIVQLTDKERVARVPDLQSVMDPGGDGLTVQVHPASPTEEVVEEAPIDRLSREETHNPFGGVEFDPVTGRWLVQTDLEIQN